MKNKLTVFLISSVLAISLTSVSALAVNNGVGHDHQQRNSASQQSPERFMKHKLKKMARYLKLTDEQRQQSKVIHKQEKESRLALKESLQNFHQQSKLLVMEDSFNEQAFLDLQNQYQDTFAQMALIKAKTKHSFIKLLTEEQKEKMKSRKWTGERRSNSSE